MKGLKIPNVSNMRWKLFANLIKKNYYSTTQKQSKAKRRKIMNDYDNRMMLMKIHSWEDKKSINGEERTEKWFGRKINICEKINSKSFFS